MKKFLAAIVLIALSSGCSKSSSPSLPCTAANLFKPIAVGIIKSSLSCSNDSAISGSVDQVFQKVGVCNAPAAGVFSPLCSAFVAPLVDLAVGAAIPASWGCSGGAPKATLESALMSACSKI